MPDTTFETFLTGQLRAYADAGVRPIDRFAIAQDAIAGGRTMRGWRRGWGRAPMRRSRVLIPLLVGLLLAALAGGALLVGSRLEGPKRPLDTSVSIFVRRVTDPTPGVAVLAVDADGAETLIRHVPDSLVGGTLGEWGTVSSVGWLALAVGEKPWPMVLVDLRDETSAPWVVNEASTGGIGPSWGPTGLIAADAGGNGSQVVIADPEARTTRIIDMHGGLVGGGPSIVWTADGTAIAGTTAAGAKQVVPIDGGDPRPGVGDVFDPRGLFGSGLAGLRICTADAGCQGAADGRVERVDGAGAPPTIWHQQGADRVLSAGFGNGADEYWLTISRANGTQVGLVHVQGGEGTTAATVNRDAGWQYVAAPVIAPDGSVAVLWITVSDKTAAVVVPLAGAQQTFHPGSFAGFVNTAAIARPLAGHLSSPGQAVPSAGESYRLPTADKLIAEEEQVNPGRRVLGMGSHDTVTGDPSSRETTVTRNESTAGELHLDCIGPTGVTVTVGSQSETSPCLAAGAYIMQIDATSPIVVAATGDTSWRVVVYTP